MFIVAGVVSAVSWVVRYRILNMYSRLPPEPPRAEPEIDLFPDTHDGGTKSGLSSYLDEFLSAIKIFGYLERPVFHELTRSMQTRKLIAGETINLEEEKGFCIVVDGLVEIFVKSPGVRRRDSPGYSGNEDSDEDDITPDKQQYQLLTEVRNGAPMSSLFSIMSLFTEDVKLRSGEDHNGSGPSQTRGQRGVSFSTPQGLGVPIKNQVPVSMPNTPQLDGTRRHAAHVNGTAQPVPSFSTVPSSRIPEMSLDEHSNPLMDDRPPPPRRQPTASAHPDIIARATVDTTIAIIPASAFRRLIKIYPKATAHIVHVILSRFQRVTLSQAFNYLGLKANVLQTEKSMLKYTSCQLPNVLRGDALTRLKEKFSREREQINDGQEDKGIALHNSAAGRRRRSSTHLRKEAVRHILSKHSDVPKLTAGVTQTSDRASAVTPGPGDLLSNLQLSRTATKLSLTDGFPDLRLEPPTPMASTSFNPFNSQRHQRISLDQRESLDEDNLFRASILECIFNALGLESMGGTTSREPESVEASPRLVSYDQKRSKAYFSNNAFGFLGSFESGSVDGDTDSVTSGGLNPAPNPQALANDLKDEVEIVFFPQGSVLVEQGERNPGIYYVVDGFLDIGTSMDEGSSNIFRSESTNDHTDFPQFSDSFANLGRTESGRESREYQRQEKSKRRTVALVKPGGLAGYIGSVSSYRSFIDVVAKTDVYVGFLPLSSLERIVDKYPIVLLTIAKRLTSILPRLILHIDFALEWVQVNAGQVIYHDQDESDAIYIVLNGRLRLVEDKKDGGMVSKAEYGQGESVGELEVLTETARSGTLHAIRDTELVKFPRTLFNSLAQEHPNITIKISKIIASRMRAVVDSSAKFPEKEHRSGASTGTRNSTMNLRTVTILPVSAGVPVIEFGHRLMNAIDQVGTPNGAVSLNQASILNHLGKHAFNKMGKLRLSQYLADLEEKYGLVVYIAGKNEFFSLLIPSYLFI